LVASDRLWEPSPFGLGACIPIDVYQETSINDNYYDFSYSVMPWGSSDLLPLYVYTSTYLGRGTPLASDQKRHLYKALYGGENGNDILQAKAIVGWLLGSGYYQTTAWLPIYSLSWVIRRIKAERLSLLRSIISSGRIRVRKS
jgi:hypothetical protein